MNDMAQAGMFPPPQGQQAPQSAPPTGGGGFMDALSGFLGNHQNALLGLGAGIASGGLRQGVPGMAQGAQQDYTRNLQQSSLAQTYQAILEATGNPAIAKAAALNPEVLKAVAGSLYARPALTDFGTDPLTGQKNMQWTNPLDKSVTPAVPGGQGGAATTSSQLFDQIATARQQGASQQDLLKMLPNSLQEGVSAMIDGRAVPANLSMRGAARDLTLRLAQEVDPTFDQTKIPERIKFATQMAETTPNSAGGQKQLLNTSLQHLGELSDHLTALDNISGGVAQIGWGVNAIGNLLPGGAAVKNSVNTAAQNTSGEIGKLYSGASGGGEREREATAGRFSPNNTPQESAAALETTKAMVLDKLNSLQNQRDQVYGTKGEGIYPLIDPQTKAALQKIDANIAKLRGGVGGTTATQATGLPAGWSVQVR